MVGGCLLLSLGASLWLGTGLTLAFPTLKEANSNQPIYSKLHSNSTISSQATTVPRVELLRCQDGHPTAHPPRCILLAFLVLQSSTLFLLEDTPRGWSENSSNQVHCLPSLCQSKEKDMSTKGRKFRLFKAAFLFLNMSNNTIPSMTSLLRCLVSSFILQSQQSLHHKAN